MGCSGGIGIFWNNEINLNILGYSQYHIDASVQVLGTFFWRITCVYGEAKTHERYKTCNKMKDISSGNSLPWLCIRDFNEVLRAYEHVGIGQRSQAQIQGFREQWIFVSWWTWVSRVTFGPGRRRLLADLTRELGWTELWVQRNGVRNFHLHL
jgi:hypothetical protein